MKQLSYLFLLLLCVPILSKAQEVVPDSNNITNSIATSGEASTPSNQELTISQIREQINQKQEAVQEQIQEIEEVKTASEKALEQLNTALNKNVKTKLGEFTLLVQDNDKIKSDLIHKYKFKSISFKIQYGAINTLLLKTVNDSNEVVYFYNTHPIEIKKLWKWEANHPTLKIWNKDNESLFLTNVISFEPSGQSGTVHQKDITLDAEDTNAIVYSKETFQSMIDFRVYTDAFSLLGESPNGLAQFETSSEFFINAYRLRATQIISSVEPFLNIIRFDDKNATVSSEILDSTTYKVNDLMSLHQRSFFRFGSKLNLVSYQGRSYEKFSLDIYAKGTFNNSKLKATYNGEERETYYKHVTASLGIRMGVKRIKRYGVNFGLDALQNWGIPTNNVQDIRQFGILQYHQEVFLFTGKEDEEGQDYKSDAMFLRFNYFDNLNKASGDYFQLEIGYKKKLTF